ncbi:hypothetical protein X766_28625 [Mesorhizobium sp. LSJC255A00]|nr:hypothetical protein X766_28625 [Mesorhizobium sp. LSJC255A00]
MRQKDRQAQIAKNAFGCSTHDKISHPGMAVCTHNKQIGAHADSARLKRNANGAIFEVD